MINSINILKYIDEKKSSEWKIFDIQIKVGEIRIKCWKSMIEYFFDVKDINIIDKFIIDITIKIEEYNKINFRGAFKGIEINQIDNNGLIYYTLILDTKLVEKNKEN